MTSMTGGERVVIGGVDTHRDTHHVAVIDEVGRELADREFPASRAGYRRLLGWLAGHGRLARVGVEGSGAYGAGLVRYLRGRGVVVVEVDRPDRRARRRSGKSDPLDAYAAARAVLSGRASGTPKAADGPVEAIRALRVARSGAVKARTQAMNQLRGLLVSAPAGLREQLQGLGPRALVTASARLRPEPVVSAADPALAAAKTALRSLARRHQDLTAEIAGLDPQIRALAAAAAPTLLALPGVGPEVGGQLLVSAGDNPERLRSQAAFAHLCGTAPIPASSGRTDRHRLNRGGDRAANAALYTVVLNRLRYHPDTRAYAARRTAQGLTKKEIIRCLKRYVARETYHAIMTDRAIRTAAIPVRAAA
ncbi:MAG TPA: IS110 family transposase [Jiangellales bacterium]|nr:IS110 family transposase [Jiangellales bacterium]